MKVNLRLAWATVLVLLTACGSGGGSSERTPPGTPTLNLAFGLKELRFSWAAVADADFYRLFENPDGVSGLTQIGGNLTGLSFNLSIPVHRRVNASYVLQACNTGGCSASSAAQTLGSSHLQAIGFLKSSNPGADDEFGVALALSADGNTLAVGAPYEDSEALTFVGSAPNENAPNAGAVYVFSRSATGWSQEAYIKASNAGQGDTFGFAVALSADGNTLAVGAPGEDSGTTGVNSTPNETAADSGAAYVFTRSSGVWSQHAYIKASNTGAGDGFGFRVALSGDGNTLAVGAPSEDSGSAGVNSTADESASNSGAAYVFTRVNVGPVTVWSQQAYLKASNPGGSGVAAPLAPGDQFGVSVALSTDGNTLAIGADWEDSSTTGVNSTPNESATGSGAVYVFTRSGTTWSQQAYVKASNASADDRFGISVSLSGDGNTLAVGAFAEGSSGAAYVFTRTAGAWSQQAFLKASNPGGGDLFGISVALSADGTTLAVGADQEASSTIGVNSSPNNAALGAGAVYVFTRTGSAWAQVAYVKASNTGLGDAFGFAVALSSDGNTLAVGAESEDSNTSGVGAIPNESASYAGAVYLY